MPILTINGVDAYFRDEGQGPGVILLHSSSSSSGQWRPLMERLGTRFRSLAPDLHGYGRTGAWPAERGRDLYDDETAIIAALLDQLDGPVHLVGHSYGGALAAMAALAFPERTATLTLIEPTLFPLLQPAGEQAAHDEIHAIASETTVLTEAGRPEDAARLFLDYWVGPGALNAMPPDRRDAVVATMDKLRHEWPFRPGLSMPTLDDLATITCPVLLVRASGTTHAASACIELLRSALKSHAFAEIPGAGHMSPVTHPQKVNPVIEAFLVQNADAG
ncbi:MAG: alpha/beta hydrolase [Alphaproteobacteria bacterium]|nr:alpha/beta hydrolase [Alphaproteobacteria bacterium]